MSSSDPSLPGTSADVYLLVKPGSGHVTGEVIDGRYTLREPLGRDPAGTFWVAEHHWPLLRRAILKILDLPKDAEALRRAQFETHVAASLDHPHLSRVLDAGTTKSGHPFLVVERASGISLTSFCADSRPDFSDRMALGLQACSAVQHAHNKGVLHERLSPSNLLVTMRDGQPWVTVVNFTFRALDKLFLPVSDHPDTDADLSRFVAPEQRIERRDVDSRCDVYALGAILRDLFAAELNSRRVAHDGRNLKMFRLRAIITKCCSEGRDRRYDTASGLADDIRRFLRGEKTEAEPVPGIVSAIRAAFATGRSAQTYITIDRDIEPDWQVTESGDSAIRELYEQMRHPSLLGWKDLSDNQRATVRQLIVDAALDAVSPSSNATGHLVIDAETIAAIRAIPDLLKSLQQTFQALLSSGSVPPAAPDGPNHGGSDDDFELRTIWLQLVSEQRAILRFVRKAGDTNVTYRLMSLNVELPRLPGDVRSETMNDKTVAKHCQPLERVPLLLLERDGKRRGVRLTLRGHRIVTIHAGKSD